MLMLAASIMTVSACSTRDDKPVVKVEFIRPLLPAEARVPCAKPVQTPDRRITAAEVKDYWDRDRSHLEICEQRRSAAVNAVEAGQ